MNEVGAHTDFSDPGRPEYDSNDWSELINGSDMMVSVDGYYLSDDPLHLKKWSIPGGTILSPGPRIVFDEVTGFHSPITNGFGLNKAGEQVLLSYAPESGLASVVDAVQFKGQENGSTLGRLPDAEGHWAVCLPTPGSNNMPAGQSPILSEIMYHPVELTAGLHNTEDEFVEVFNPSGHGVNLWSTERGTNIGSWRLTGQVEYTFPSNTVLAVFDRVLVVSFDPVTNVVARAAFLSRYGLGEPVLLLGPFAGRLSNQGGRVALEKPMSPDLPEDGIAWVIVDEVFYANATPWMPTAAGLGHSLQRLKMDGTGLDPGSRTAWAPTPASGGSSAPELRLRIMQTATALKLGFDLPPGFGYVIEMSTNLVNEWTPCATVSNGVSEYLIDTTEVLIPAFFRVRRKP